MFKLCHNKPINVKNKGNNSDCKLTPVEINSFILF